MSKNSEELKKIQKQIDDLINSSRKLGDLTKEQADGLKKQAEGLEKGTGTLEQHKALYAQIKSTVDNIADELDYIQQSNLDSLQSLMKQNVALSIQKGALKKLTGIAGQLEDIRIGEVTYTAKQINQLKESARQEIKRLELAKKQVKKSNEDANVIASKVKELKSQIKDNSEILSISNDILEVDKQINKNLGFTPKILGGIDKGLQKLGFDSLGIDKAVQETKRLGQEFEVTGKKGEKFKAFNVFFQQLGKNIKDAFSFTKLLEVGFGTLFTVGMGVDKATGELAKNIGVSYDESLALQKNFNQIAIDSDNIMVSSAALNKSFVSLNQQFQGTTNFSKETLESFTALTAQAGFSEETIGNIAKLTGAQGDEINDNVALLQGELAAMNAVNGTTFSTKQMLEDIGKINKSTLLILNQQPQALAKTLYTSRKLGLSFAEMEGIASSMLDFESSITNELEAELLTGKDLNLERARSLALSGDIAGASEEIAKQVGSAEKFGKMNVIQQEALAKAVGLTKDQLANSLIEQEAIAKLSEFEGDTARERYQNAVAALGVEGARKALGNDILADQMDSQSVQERFAASVERLKEIFIDLSAELLPIVSSIANMVVGVAKLVTKFSPFIKLLTKAFLIFKGIKMVIGGIGKGLDLVNTLSKKIVGFKKLEFNFGKKGLVQARAAAFLNKLGLVTDKQSAFFKGRIAFFENASNLKAKNRLMFENASLFSVLRRNIAEKAGNVLKGIGNALGLTSLSTTVAEGAAETVITAQKQAQNRSMIGLITKGLTYLGTLVAQAAAAIAQASALTLGIGTIAVLAAAAAGIAYLYSITKPKKAGDMISAADGKTQISTKEGGLFELSQNDDLIAAPGIASKKENKREGRRAERTGENSQKIIDLLTTQNNFLKTIAAKSTSIIMNGNEVGQGINTSERAIQ